MMMRRNLLAAAATLLLATVSGHAEPTAGLAERRAITAYRESTYPGLEEAIRKAAGFDVPVEVEWDQLAVPGDAKYYADPGYFGKTIFEPLATGLSAVTKDQMGRDAVRQKLKKIQVRYDSATATSNYAKGLSFENGVLSVNWRPFANTADVQPRVDAIVQTLEKNL